jgi:hypothetical protein
VSAARWRVRRRRFPWTGEMAWKAEAPLDNTPPQHRYFGGFHFATFAEAIEYADAEARKAVPS